MNAKLTAVLFLAVATLHAEDWPQWLGPQRDGVWRETGIVETFPAGGPKVRWRVPVNAGYTGPAVANGRVYLMDRKAADAAGASRNAFARGEIPGNERVLCLDERDGKLIWEHTYDCPYTVSYAAGPRATPLVSGGKVYTLGTEGHLLCLDAEKGGVIWAHDFQKEFGIRSPMWGFSAHPLLDENRLICLVGGAGSVAVAFDKDSGKELWRALSAREPGYCPPTMIEHDGARKLVIWHPQAVNVLDPANGSVLWSHPWEVRSGLSIATPRFVDGRLFLSAFYNSSKCFKPDGTLLWEGKSFSEKNTDTLHSLMSTPFIEDGHIYGVCSYGQLRCLKLATGERVWETFAATTGAAVRWGHAFIIKHAGRFFLANEQGDLIIAKMSPQGYEEISRAHLLDPANHDARRPVVWSHPAFANKSVYARNDRELVCVSLAVE